MKKGDVIRQKCVNTTFYLTGILAHKVNNVSDYDQGKMNDLKRNIGEIQFHNTADKASLEWRNYDASHGISSTLFNLTTSRKLTNRDIHI